MYYTIALTFASTLAGQTRWSEAYFKESLKDPETPPRLPARKVPLGSGGDEAGGLELLLGGVQPSGAGWNSSMRTSR